MIDGPAKNLQFLLEPLRIKIIVMGVGGENMLKFPIARENNQEKKWLTSDGIIGGHTNICFLKVNVVHGVWEEKSDPVEKAAKIADSYGAAMPRSEQERKGSSEQLLTGDQKGHSCSQQGLILSKTVEGNKYSMEGINIFKNLIFFFLHICQTN